jgi:hypothetical protein
MSCNAVGEFSYCTKIRSYPIITASQGAAGHHSDGNTGYTMVCQMLACYAHSWGDKHNLNYYKTIHKLVHTAHAE